MVVNDWGWGDPPKRRKVRAGLWRGPLLALVMLISLATGFWFGGDTGRGVSVWAMVALGIVVLLGDLLGSPDRMRSRLVSAIFVAALFAGGWYAGILELERAFTDCVERGEELRSAIEEHHRATGRFPASLEELDGIETPGRRLLRPDLMRYSSSADGYDLSFSDASVNMSATHESGFFDSGTPTGR